MVGGLNAAGAAVATVESYDPVADRWTAGPDLPVALHHHATVNFRGVLFVIGGFLVAGDLYSRPTDRVFALRNGAWTDMAPLRRPRGAAAAAIVDDRIVVVGGRDAGLLIGPSEAYDGGGWQDRAPIPTLRDHVATDSDGRALYAVGGRFLSPGRTTGALERYDPVRDAWETLPAMPTPRGGLGAAFLSGRLVAAGGEDSSDVYPQVEAFDVATGTWSTLPSMPVPRHGLALNAVGSSLYALVGGSRFGVAPSRAAEVLG
ncbi:MAG: Kelch repeat-containing protein [Acidimicrobiales bacterium]